MKKFKALMALMIFSLSYLVIYYLHISFFAVDIVFYAALFDAVLASMVTAFIFVLPFFSVLEIFEKQLIIIICLLVGYAVSISVPTVIDRSLSFYILEKIEQRGSIKLINFEEVFTKEYAKEHRLVDVRLTEQLASGTIKIEDGCVTLTDWGKWLAEFSRYFRQNLLPKQRLLMGEYTADLTDPFRDSEKSVSYECQ